MRNSRPIIVIPLVCFLSSALLILCEPSASACNEKEKHALLIFKRALSDPGNRLSSWSIDQDCCTWESVHCNNITGRVVELHLGCPFDPHDFELYMKFALRGEISPALLDLEFLSYLNLSGNYFGGRPIPNFLGSMGSLRYLDLSDASFGGPIPHQLGNLWSLRHLDLGYNYGLIVQNLSWIPHLPFLKYLCMNGLDLHGEVHWLESVSMLPSLSELHLSGCHLHENMFSPPGYVNFSSLTLLDLSGNDFSQEMPNWLLNISTTLSFLNLSDNDLHGQISESIGQLKHLEILDLSSNSFDGPISESIGQLKHLEILDLSSNSFDGPIPITIGNLSSLRDLDLHANPFHGTLPRTLGLLSNLERFVMGQNSITGTISEVHFTALSKLKVLDISKTSLSFHVNSNWTPPFQLQYLDASSCKMGPKFPAWLQTQKFLFYLDFSMSGIRDRTPNWFWKWASNIQKIHLSNNQISGDLSQVVLNSTFIDLSSNSFTGLLPRLSPNAVVLNMANNSFAGEISPLMCRKMNGRNKLEVLDISLNAFSGELSDCWMHWPSLAHVRLRSNNMSGTIPKSMSSLVGLKALSLRNNSFHGEVTSWLENCKALGVIDLSHNKFSGAIPGWLFERTTLMIISLRSNEFMGNIPPQICNLSYLRVLDLADNSLSGTIPKCLNNFGAMAEGPNYNSWYEALEADYKYESYFESLIIHIKGRDSDYGVILTYVRGIDLSSNNLSGSIPDEIFSLSKLLFLNLSHNHLTGMLSANIGGMEYLEALDLSRNHLSGEIPQSMENLTFLSVLDLSYNGFSGRIPQSTQLQSFASLIYFGNAELCGPPLEKNCTEDEETPGLTAVKEKRGLPEVAWFYIGMGSGFFAGFWGVFGTLFCQRAWRHAYFQFVEDMKDWVYVAVAIKLKWFRHKFRRFSSGKAKVLQLAKRRETKKRVNQKDYDKHVP